MESTRPTPGDQRARRFVNRIEYVLEPDQVRYEHNVRRFAIDRGAETARDAAAWWAGRDLDRDTLLFPVYLEVGGRPILVGECAVVAGRERPGWRLAAVVRAATDGLRALRPEATGPRIVWLDAATAGVVELEIVPDGSLVTVTAYRLGPNGRRARRLGLGTGDYRDLTERWRAFAESVRLDLLGALPELAGHERYGPWFREGEAALPAMWADWESDDGE